MADVKCRKDHTQILDNTCMPEMIKGVNLIERSHIVFSQESIGNNKSKMILHLQEDVDEQPDDEAICNTFKPTIFIAGDCAFLAYLMGKDNYSSTWCNWCKMPALAWKTASNTNVNNLLWSVNQICKQVSINKMNRYSDKWRMGVRTLPVFMNPFDRIFFSGLHASIGICNLFVNKLEEFIHINIEHISPEEFQLRETKSSTCNQIKLLQAEKKEWLESADGGRLLNKKRTRSKG